MDGFGHQLHGLFSTLVLHKIKNIYFNAETFINKNFFFEHLDEKQSLDAKKYLIECVRLFEEENLVFSKECNNFVQLNSINEVLNKNNKDFVCAVDNAYYFEKLELDEAEKEKHQKNIIDYKKYFINQYLPPCRLKEKNIVIHIRQGDALKTDRKKSLSDFMYNLSDLVKIFRKKYPEHNLYIHSDENIDFLKGEKISIFTKETDILNVLSDFIHAEIFVANNSSLSEVSCFLGDKKTIIVNDDSRVSKPSISIKMSDYIHINKNYLVDDED